jgi:hypothetical protein
VRDEALIVARRQFVQNSYDNNADVVDATTPKRDERIRRVEIVELAVEQLALMGLELAGDSLRAREK